MWSLLKWLWGNYFIAISLRFAAWHLEGILLLLPYLNSLLTQQLNLSNCSKIINISSKVKKGSLLSTSNFMIQCLSKQRIFSINYSRLSNRKISNLKWLLALTILFFLTLKNALLKNATKLNNILLINLFIFNQILMIKKTIDTEIIIPSMNMSLHYVNMAFRVG